MVPKLKMTHEVDIAYLFLEVRARCEELAVPCMKGADTASPYLVAMPAPVLPTPPKSPLKLPPWSRVDGGARGSTGRQREHGDYQKGAQTDLRGLRRCSRHVVAAPNPHKGEGKHFIDGAPESVICLCLPSAELVCAILTQIWRNLAVGYRQPIFCWVNGT